MNSPTGTTACPRGSGRCSWSSIVYFRSGERRQGRTVSTVRPPATASGGDGWPVGRDPLEPWTTPDPERMPLTMPSQRPSGGAWRQRADGREDHVGMRARQRKDRGRESRPWSWGEAPRGDDSPPRGGGTAAGAKPWQPSRPSTDGREIVAVMLDPRAMGGQDGTKSQTPLETLANNRPVATTCMSAMRPEIRIRGATP